MLHLVAEMLLRTIPYQSVPGIKSSLPFAFSLFDWIPPSRATHHATTSCHSNDECFHKSDEQLRGFLKLIEKQYPSEGSSPGVGWKKLEPTSSNVPEKDTDRMTKQSAIVSKNLENSEKQETKLKIYFPLNFLLPVFVIFFRSARMEAQFGPRGDWLVQFLKRQPPTDQPFVSLPVRGSWLKLSGRVFHTIEAACCTVSNYTV